VIRALVNILLVQLLLDMFANTIVQCTTCATGASAKTDVEISLNRRVASSLALDDDPERPRVDFIVFLVSMQALNSMQQLASVHVALDADFCFGRICVIATHGACVFMYCEHKPQSSNVPS
jgi:hypothetical protein